MNGCRRLALVLIVLMCAAAAHLAWARSWSSARFGEPHGSSVTVLTQHADDAVVPATQLVRSVHSLGRLLNVPLAAVLAFVTLLALWLTASVRRRERLACAVVTYRRRGPPALPHVI